MRLHATVLLAALACSASAADIAFNRDIRPILSENCFACHGFDSKKRKADLRLDTPEGAYSALDGNIPVKPGNLAQSTVWQRLTTTDPDDLMPPADSHKKLTPAQIDLIKRWIEQGAPYQKHWAFEKPVQPSLPTPPQPNSTLPSPIDAFLLTRLQSENLTFAPEADKPTLIRRAAFALTGLPPTLDEVTAFESDTSPQAYERVVDRYLASKHHGEEMARHWLDLARYADTHGLHLDNERTMWAYRDWVVNAFNQNLPFDQFTLWQIAGDLLPNATPDQITATGFNRCNVTTSEGGSINEEFLYRYAVDRTATLTETWMGLTGGCAVCHDHKYDPLTTAEFYSLYAFFYSAADPPMDGNIALTTPVMTRPAPAQQHQLEAAQKHEAQARQHLKQTAAQTAYADPAELTAPPAKQKTTLSLLDDRFLFGASLRNTSRNPSVWDAQPAFGSPSGNRVLRQENAFYTEERLDPKTLPVLAPENAAFSIWVYPDPASPPELLSILINTHRVFWGDATLLQERIDADANTTSKGPLPKPGQWSRLTFTLADLSLKPGQRIPFIALEESGGRVWWDDFTLTGETSPATDPLASFTVWWKTLGKDATIGVPATLQPVLKAGPSKPTTPAQRASLLEFYLAHIARPATLPKPLAQARATWDIAATARETIEAAIPATLVFRDLDSPRDAFVMIRGDYTKPGDKVEPTTPAFLPALQKAAPESRATRLDLARWLISPDHPLTARVYVNRLWQQFFGTGLVASSHDFGSQGQPPSHPELLDWLAVTFQQSGWNTRTLVKQIVLSQAFRQAATPPHASDPDNRLLSRGPRFRLDAEQIRDNALFVSGLIQLDMGGRGTKTYQPPNIWEPVGYANSNTRYYLQDHGPSLYRRSLYSFLKRTAPPPFMDNFDAPNREQPCSRRERSNTPMQALQLLNDTQHFEAARALAERVLAETPARDDTARLHHLFRLVLSRLPDPREQSLLLQALAKQRALFTADPPAAAATIRSGETPPKNLAPAPETAAWTLLANLVLNLDETITRN